MSETMLRNDVVIMLESFETDFRQEAEEWKANYLQGLPVSEFTTDGNFSVTFTVPEECLAVVQQALRETGPPHLYLASLHHPDRILKNIQGPAFPVENARMAKAAGRHVLLSALPSELAKARKARDKKSPIIPKPE